MFRRARIGDLVRRECLLIELGDEFRGRRELAGQPALIARLIELALRFRRDDDVGDAAGFELLRDAGRVETASDQDQSLGRLSQ